MKKGFTLAELLGVILLLSVISLIVIPTIDKQLKEGRQELYDKQISLIKSGVSLFESDYKLNDNERIRITLSQLKSLGYVEHDITNPITKEIFPNDAIIEITNDNYNIDVTGDNIKDYNSLPTITLNGNVVEFLELGSTYIEKEAQAKYNNEVIDNITISGGVDNLVVGSNYITYTVDYNGFSNKVIRTILVRDTKAPTINFNTDLTISLNQTSTYDFKKDVTVEDASEIESFEVKTNFIDKKGIYSIKYVATDIYGNTTTKNRKVIVTS